MLEVIPRRFYDFERCFNFRDLGGYITEDGRRLRWGRLYRSMTPQFMTEADVARVRDVLGIRTIVDLRREESAKPGAFADPPFRRRVIPFVTTDPGTPHDTARDLILSYVLHQSGRRVVEAMEFIASGEDEAPALFHCYTGKDRTGVLAAVILRFLGVSDADVMQDYLHSATAVGEMQVYAAAHELPSFPELPETAPAYVREAPQAHWLTGVLEALRPAGSAREYLTAHGAPKDTLERFRALMLE